MPNPYIAERLAEYEAGLSLTEKALIARSPSLAPPDPLSGLAPWPLGLELARCDVHAVVPALRRAFGSRPNLHIDPDFFGLALKLATFELHNSTVHGWPGFVVLMYKMLGDDVLPWLPPLFLAAMTVPGIDRHDFDLEEVLEFRADVNS